MFVLEICLMPVLALDWLQSIEYVSRNYCFLNKRSWILPWIKSISSELDIIIHVIMSQLSFIVMSSAIDCDVIGRMKTKRVRHGDDVYRLSFLSSFMDTLCHVRNKTMYVLLSQTVSVLTWVLFLCLFPELLCNSENKHKKTSRDHRNTSSLKYIHYSLWTIQL